MVTKADLKNLEAEVNRLHEHYREQERHREKLIDAAVSRARSRAEKDTEPQKREIDDSRKAYREARERLDAAKVAHATASDEGPIVGTVLHEWKRDSYGYRLGDWKKSGRTGVVRVWDNGSAHPPNIRYSLPSVGDKYIRVLKRDGSESTTFDTLRGWRSEWHEADWKPPVVKSERRF